MHHPETHPPPAWRRALAWLTRSKIRPAPSSARVTLPRVGSLEELEEHPPAWLCIHTKEMGELGARRPSAMVICPAGHRFAIAGGHSVGGATGHVEPTVGCPEAGCGWLELLELEGWAP